MRANTDRAPGVSLVTDVPGGQVVTVDPQPGDFDFDAVEFGPERDLIALRGRITAGLGVQLLLDRLTTQTFVTIVLNGDTETFEVQPQDANEAFEHPYAYGATLPL